ncbi:unnamed protein product [Peniophora sp. CBMAI 1063]|nr:unnamed protein product [Peniophora sp. CBMAI 1063]
MTSLWADIVGVLPLATGELLERAGSSPLSLTLRTSDRRVLDFDYWMPEYVEPDSIRSLYVHSTNGRTGWSPLQELLYYLDVGSLDSLEHLDVTTNGRRKHDDEPLVTPSLRSAKMFNCIISFTGASILQRLSIVYDMNCPGYNGWRLDSPFDCLSSCRATLQELQLLRCLGLSADMEVYPPENSGPGVRLSALRRLDIGSHSDQVLPMIKRHFRYPPGCEVAFSALPYLQDGSGVPDLNHRGPDAAFYSALSTFADELLERGVGYKLVFDNSSPASPSVSVCEETSTICDEDAEPDVPAQQHRGMRAAHIDSAKRRGVLFGDNIFCVLAESFRHLEEGDDTSILENMQTLCVTSADTVKGFHSSVVTVFLKTKNLRALHMHGYDLETLKGLCENYRGLVLPELAILRLSAGTKPLSCTYFAHLMALRAIEIEKVKGAKRLARLIVDKDVVLADPEMEDVVVKKLTDLVDELDWRSR